MRELFEYHLPSRYVVGTVGSDEDRQYFLQSSDQIRTTTVSLEQGQVAVLAEGLDRILDELHKLGFLVPVFEPGDLDLEPLDLPIESEFAAQSMGLAWNEQTHLVTLEIHGAWHSDEIPDVEEDPIDGPPCLRARLTLEQSRAFIARSKRILNLVSKPCQYCQLPIEPNGHICPRANGYRR